MHGKGIYTYSNGDKYEGEFKNDSFNGKGTLIYSLEDRSEVICTYVGEFKNDERELAARR